VQSIFPPFFQRGQLLCLQLSLHIRDVLHRIQAPTLRVVRCSRYGQPLTKVVQAHPGKCNPWHHVSGSLSHSVLLSPYHLNTDKTGSPPHTHLCKAVPFFVISTNSWVAWWNDGPSHLESLTMGVLVNKIIMPNSSLPPIYRIIIPRRKWQPTPVFLPGESHGQRSLVGYSPWVAKSQTRLSDFTFTFLQLYREHTISPSLNIGLSHWFGQFGHNTNKI